MSVDYVATQYLTEIFKMEKYEGVIYKSSLSTSGYNLTLLDDMRFFPSVKVEEVHLRNVDTVKYGIRSPYKIKRRRSSKKAVEGDSP
ncbi:MAG: RES family NAD+ phosphorylase [Candidatus Omnitrophica bacterium]|nr:RES family NAD+ phosphorylase [Candidatus Omnitrophota bacterium]MDE2008494.1 RES family NAD+ phosphorylase [Candidatus Omnitrophota bacterium]MDE2213960.1 RES family NAD+ phosphorylase [Candidatus Omnitrophota bacterium]MDE2231385.1 RES family NAD+ phosphorylase [Candidatus Omnitrophota bacterium]